MKIRKRLYPVIILASFAVSMVLALILGFMPERESENHSRRSQPAHFPIPVEAGRNR